MDESMALLNRKIFQSVRLVKRSKRLIFFSIVFVFISLNLLTSFIVSHENKPLAPVGIIKHLYNGDINNFKNLLSQKIRTSDDITAISKKPNFDDDESINITSKYARRPVPGSPFEFLKEITTSTEENNKNDKRKKRKNKNLIKKIKSVKEGFTLQEWNDPSVFSILDQCKLLIDTIYHEDPNWSNYKNFKIKPHAKYANNYLSIAAERLRIYNYCFVYNDLKPTDVFDNIESDRVDISRKYLGVPNFNPRTFHTKMFPFLGDADDKEYFVPKIINLNSMQPIDLNISVPIKEHNDNFWQSWASLAKGRGIVTTFPEKHCDYFLRFLRTLQHVQNKLPIQILVKENELSKENLEKLSKIAIETDQELYLVTFTNLINKQTTKRISKFINKFFASLFNTFEEFILIDADSISFINPEEYFNFTEYQSSGLYITRDRIVEDKGTQECLDSFYHLEPSLEEVEILKTSLLYTRNALNESTPNGQAYKAYFNDISRHSAESSLLTINKKQSFAGLLMSAMLFAAAKVQACSHGDKEFFWFGPLFAGSDFQFEPTSTVLIGFPQKEYDNEGNYIRTTLCDSHITHLHDGKLTWTNGCLSRLKDADGKFKNPRMRANGYLIPGSKNPEWKRKNTDLGDMFCATAVENGSLEPKDGYVGWLDEPTYQNFEEISLLWNKDL